MKQKDCFLFIFIFMMVFLTDTYIKSQELDNTEMIKKKKCINCHAKEEFRAKFTKDGRNVYVNLKRLKNSVHKDKLCTDCHSDVIEIPHTGQRIRKVDCTQCHYVNNDKGVPNSPLLYKDYLRSIHAKLLSEGNEKAPRCQDCHGSHYVKKAKNPKSKVYKLHIPDTCGKCHKKIYRTYIESIHGQKLLEGDKNVPVCTDCHGEHKIRSHNDPSSKVFTPNLEKTCSACHSDERIMGKYGVLRRIGF